MDGWCVLRMAAPRTITVANSLRAAGIDVWTPIVAQVRRVPRSKKLRSVEMPLLPTFAFAPYMDVPLLLSLLADPVPKHPPFTVFRHGNGFPKIADHQLNALREIEETITKAANIRAKRLRPRDIFLEGQHVHAPDGPFAGLEGTVVRDERGKAGLVMVLFPGLSIPVKIAPWHLERIDGTGTQPEHGTAALAA